MAYLTITAESSVYHLCTIQDLGSVFTPANYICAGISSEPVTYGASYVNGMLATVNASYDTPNYSVSLYLSNLIPGITYYAFAQSNNGLYYPAGQAVAPSYGGGGSGGGQRPPVFNWTYAGLLNGQLQFGSRKVSGYGFFVGAGEWNSLTSNINAVRQYRGFGSAYFTAVSSGMAFTAAIFNEAIYALNSIVVFYYPTTHMSRDAIYANELNALVDVLNGIQ